MVEEVFRVVKEINASGVTVLLVEQNTQHALALASRGTEAKRHGDSV